MGIVDLINNVSLLVLILVWIAYLAEAWKQTAGQALLVLLLPGYVFYFAFVRSQYGRPMRAALTALAATCIISS